MTPQFHPSLINGPCDDPGVYVDFLYERRHLTALQAGRLAQEAGAARVIPFHFSPRYRGREEQLLQELEGGR